MIKIDKLGSNIKKFRSIKKLSLKELAKEIDVSPSMLSQIESGKANPSLNTLKLISKNSDEYQLSYDLLSPDMKGDVQLCEMKLSGFQYNSDDFNIHKGEEVAVCSLGKIELMLETGTYLLQNGDSVRIPSGTKHRWKNPGKEDCAIIFAISPNIKIGFIKRKILDSFQNS